MKRLAFSGVALLVLLLIIVFRGSLENVGGSASTQDEPTVITNYAAQFDVSDTGVMSVHERVSVTFPEYVPKHGIYRFFDARDPNDPGARRVPQNVTVTRDGVAEQYDRYTQSGDRFVVLKIGDPNTYISAGTHVYDLRYTMSDALIAGPNAETSRLYWNLIPGGWLQPITSATLTVNLPGASRDVRCAVGQGSADGCTAQALDPQVLRVRAANLPPKTPVTVRADVATPTPPPSATLPWSQAWDGILGNRGLTWLIGVLAAALAAGAAGLGLGRLAKERRPPFPLQYEPPAGIGPAQAAYVLNERVDKDAYVGTLLYAAERGAVTLDRQNDGGWSIVDARGAQGWAGLDVATGVLARLLSGPGAAFVAARDDAGSGKNLKVSMSSVEEVTSGWASQARLVVPSGAVGAARAAWGVVFLAFILLGWLNPFGASITLAIPGLFLVGAAVILGRGAYTKRTKEARELWSRVGGFYRVLSTPQSEDRLDFAARRDLYATYLPWAVAFGCAAAWAAKYRTQLGVEPPPPTYVHGFVMHPGAFSFGDAMVSDLSSNINGAVAAYAATQASSGSGGGFGGGGGGFSGGGGGGGGGGGSW